MVELRIKKEMDSKGITIYRLSKETGIRYELLRRVFCGERKLLADELVLILEKAHISYETIK